MSTVNRLLLIGLLGPVHQIISAAELIEAGQAVPIDIRVLLLKHPDVFCKALKGMDYREELQQIIANTARNKFITNLALATKGNTLILYRYVEQHGKILYEMISEKAADGRPIYFIHGGVKIEERDRIRLILETDENAIIVATESLMSTGINIPSLENLIFACPTKSAIRVRQGIGRTLRLKEGKTGPRFLTLQMIFEVAPRRKRT